MCSDKEQAIPTIDADQAHALLSSGHGYVDVRCVVSELGLFVCSTTALTGEASMFLRLTASENWRGRNGSSSGCGRTLTRRMHLVLGMFPITCRSRRKVSFLVLLAHWQWGPVWDRLECFISFFLKLKSMIDKFKLASATLIRHVPMCKNMWYHVL